MIVKLDFLAELRNVLDVKVEKRSAVQDMFDAMWIILVTMTSVGYGGLFPKNCHRENNCDGRGNIWAFYMAMPLTIIGSQFYKIYKKKAFERSYNVSKRKNGSRAVQSSSAASRKK